MMDTQPHYNNNAMLVQEDPPAPASVSGEYVNLLKRFPGMNERIELADEKVVHRVAGK